MDLAELKRWRKVVPAVMLCASIWPLIHSFLKWFSAELGYAGDDDKIFSVVLAIAAIPLGAFYDALGVRDRIAWQKPVSALICSKLRQYFEQRSLGSKAPAQISEAQFRQMFYRQIDQDSTLKEMASRVRSNGLVVSSCVDGCIILGAAGVINVPVGAILAKDAIILWGIILIAFAAICRIFLPRLIKRHIKMTDEQVEYMKLYLSEKLLQDFKLISDAHV